MLLWFVRISKDYEQLLAATQQHLLESVQSQETVKLRGVFWMQASLDGWLAWEKNKAVTESKYSLLCSSRLLRFLRGIELPFWAAKLCKHIHSMYCVSRAQLVESRNGHALSPAVLASKRPTLGVFLQKSSWIRDVKPPGRKAGRWIDSSRSRQLSEGASFWSQ